MGSRTVTDLNTLLIVGSASIHTWRYVAGIAPYVKHLYLASNGTIPDEFRPPSLVDVLNVDFSLRAWRTPSQLRRWIQDTKPQLVHVHQANSVAWHTQRALRKLKVPLMLTVWGSDILCLPHTNRIMRHMVCTNLAAAHCLTADSRHVAAHLRALLPNQSLNIALINYGIDLPEYRPDILAKEKRVLSCRLHKPQYQIDTLLRSWASIEAEPQWADWQLTIAGEGEERPFLQQLATQLALNNVRFTGLLSPSALAALYDASRVFISIPRSDATSISLLEAMGRGCLPLLSHLPANSEWVIDGLNGIIIEDLHTLTDSLHHALEQASDPIRLSAIAQINQDLIAKKASYRDNMRRFVTCYAALLSRTP